MRLLAGVVCVMATASVAIAARVDRTVTGPGQVIGLARSGYSVAFLSGPYKGHCGPHVELWSLVSGGVFRLGRHTDDICNEGPSGGSGVTDLPWPARVRSGSRMPAGTSRTGCSRRRRPRGR